MQELFSAVAGLQSSPVVIQLSSFVGEWSLLLAGTVSIVGMTLSDTLNEFRAWQIK